MHDDLDQVAIHLKSYASSLDSLYNKLLNTPSSLRDTCSHVLNQLNYAMGVIAYRLIKLQPEDPRVSNFIQQLNSRGWTIDLCKFDEVSAKNQQVLANLLTLTSDPGLKAVQDQLSRPKGPQNEDSDFLKNMVSEAPQPQIQTALDSLTSVCQLPAAGMTNAIKLLKM